MFAHRLLLVACCGLLVGCAAEAVFIGDADSGRSTGRSDAATTDTGADGASSDVARDTEADAGTDTVDDAEADATGQTDTGVDTGNDATPDATPDADICFIDCDAVDARACDEDGRVITCADSDGDGCYQWESPRACADGTVCRGGACVEDTSCEDECEVRGAFVCITGGARAECGDFDADPCLEPGSPTPCAAGQICDDGACVDDCVDVCSDGETRCDDADNVVTCGDFDADSCLEFGDASACGADATCVDGTCRDIPDECLLISEYVEATGFDKAIELANCGGASRDLRTVGLCLFSNNDTSACSSSALLTGRLAAGDVLVLCNSRGSIVGCDTTSGQVNFNGDDRLVLYQERGGGEGFQPGTDEILDAFGQTTVRPDGEIWSDVTYRRCNPAAFDGRSVFEVTAWFTEHGVGDTSHLGVPPTLSGCP